MAGNYVRTPEMRARISQQAKERFADPSARERASEIAKATTPAPKPSDFWTPEKVAELTRLWGDGLLTSEIGRRLGCTKSAAVAKAHRLHLAGRPSPIKRSGVRVGKPRVAPAPRLPKPPKETRPTAAAPRARPLGRWQDAPVGKDDCKWPIGHPGEPDFRFCTAKAVVDQPYCREHCSVAFERSASPPAEADT